MGDLRFEVHEVELRTLGDVADAGRALYVECLTCEWLKGLDPAALVGRFGLGLALRSLRLRLTCERCHSRHIRLLLNDPMKRGDRAWSPSPPRTRRD